MIALRVIFVLFAATAALCGCRSSTFYAVSVSAKNDGGIYQFAADGTVIDFLALPTANYICRDADGKYFYVSVNSTSGRKKSPGGTAVLQKNDSNRLALLQIVPAAIKTPCHLTLSPDGKFLYTANYSSGDIAEFALEDHLLTTPRRIIPHYGKSVHRRQKSPHPHFAAFDPAGRQLFVCDLGTDRIYIYNYIPGKGLQLPTAEKCILPPGSGPRHLCFAPDSKSFYVANELNSTVSVFVRTNDNKWLLRQTLSTLLPGKTAAQNYPGAIKMSSCGKFLFVTNRGDNSIAVFGVQPDGTCRLNTLADSNGAYPSDLILLDNDQTLLAVNLKSNNIAVFTFDKKNAVLHKLEKTFAVPQGIALMP